MYIFIYMYIYIDMMCILKHMCINNIDIPTASFYTHTYHALHTITFSCLASSSASSLTSCKEILSAALPSRERGSCPFLSGTILHLSHAHTHRQAFSRSLSLSRSIALSLYLSLSLLLSTSFYFSLSLFLSLSL